MKTLKLIKNDPWLAPYKQAIEGRHNRAVEKISELTGGTGNLSDFADGYLYFGLHKRKRPLGISGVGAQCQCYLFDRKLLELERTPRISVIGHRQRSMGNKTSTRYVTPSRLLQTICTLARRTRRTHSGMGHESRARPRNIYLLGTNLGSRKAFRFFKKAVSPPNLPATDLRMSHRYGATGRKSWQLYRI